tara:strand:+ start:563 stop:1282 length:720 start_codon:yes stop_codon:yes gene_type:complete
MPIATLPPYTINSTNYALGSIARVGNGNWANIRTAVVPGTAYQSGTPVTAGVAWSGGSRGSYNLYRTFMWYDVTSYQSVTINSATFQCPLIGIVGGIANPVRLVDSSAFSNNSIITLNQSEFISTTNSDYSNSTAWTQMGGLQSITLNANGITAIQNGNSFGCAVIDNNYDYLNSQPSGIGFNAIYTGDMNSAMQRSRWTLTINYSSGWTSEINGVVNADIGSVNGVSKADISEINGVS